MELVVVLFWGVEYTGFFMAVRVFNSGLLWTVAGDGVLRRYPGV